MGPGLGYGKFICCALFKLLQSWLLDILGTSDDHGIYGFDASAFNIRV